MSLHLISHALCPYVQRAAISLIEKGVTFERTDIDLSNKPDWFLAISPLGKTPVLVVDGAPIFESAVILEYLEDTQPHALHPHDALDRARHRAWIEFGSAVLNDIAGFYSAPDDKALEAEVAAPRKVPSAGRGACGGTMVRWPPVQPRRCRIRPGLPLFRRFCRHRRVWRLHRACPCKGLAT